MHNSRLKCFKRLKYKGSPNNTVINIKIITVKFQFLANSIFRKIFTKIWKNGEKKFYFEIILFESGIRKNLKIDFMNLIKFCVSRIRKIFLKKIIIILNFF